MRGLLKDAVEQAIQPLITEITTLKGKLEETDNRVRKLEKEVTELKDEKAQQVQAQSAIVKWQREGCMIQGLGVSRKGTTNKNKSQGGVQLLRSEV